MKGNPKFFIFITSIFCALLLIGLSIPLILKKVEPNPYYGIRIDKALESDETWYEVNSYGGWALVVAGCIMLMSNTILFLFRKRLNNGAYAGIFAAIILIALFTASGITAWYASQLN